MQRRQFLQLTLAGGALGLLTLAGCRHDGDKPSTLLLSGSDRGTQHTLSGWEPGVGERFRLDVQQRVHAPLMRPFSEEALFVARRPGTAIYVVDTGKGAMKQEVAAAPGRHFYGHAVFSTDGRWLYVSENAFDEAGAGKVGVYDANANYRKIEEFDLQGIGPHQLVLMPDGVSLAVALGGIQTHPQQRRDKLNLDTMRSELLYLDRRSGAVTQRYVAPHQHLSLRHLDVAVDGTVVVGAQFQGEANPDEAYTGPLVFRQRGEQPLQAMQAVEQTWLDQNHYIASVAMNAQGTRVLTTSPRGGVVNLWHLKEARLIKQYRVRDVAGAGFLADQNSFIVSNGIGELFRVADRLELLDEAMATRWDNHLFVHV